MAASPQISAIIQTVLERCQREKENNDLQVPLDLIEERTTYYTGYSPAVVHEISQSLDKSNSLIHTFDVPERILIHSVLQMYYKKKRQLGLPQLYEMIKPSLNPFSYNEFKSEMADLGFCITPTTPGYLLTEDPKLRFERLNYLSKISAMRAVGADIVYIDVIELLPSGTADSDTCHEGKEILDSGMVIMHAVTEKKLVSYFISNNKSQDLFNKWMYGVVLQLLKPGSLVIMNDHCCLGEVLDEDITRYHTKTDMINWLNRNSILCSEKMNKFELYNLIEKCPKKSQGYAIDKLIRAYGFEVLHIPFKCKQLSLTEHLWKEMGKIDVKNIISSQQFIIAKIEHFITMNFSALNQKIQKWEVDLYAKDLKTEEVLDKNYSFDIKKIMNPFRDL